MISLLILIDRLVVLLSHSSCYCIQPAVRSKSCHVVSRCVTLCHIMVSQVCSVVHISTWSTTVLKYDLNFFSVHRVAHSRRIILTKQKHCRHFRGWRTNVEMSWPRDRTFPRVGTKNFSDTRFIVTLPLCDCQRPNHKTKRQRIHKNQPRQIRTANQMGCQPCALVWERSMWIIQLHGSFTCFLRRRGINFWNEE